MQRVEILESEPLIPGLPDDIGLNCLLRLPVAFHPAGRRVSRRWCDVLKDQGRFFKLRKQMGIQDSYLVVFSFHKHSGEIYWHVFDLVHFSWHAIPAMSCMDTVCPRGIRCVSVPGDGSVFVYDGAFVSKFDTVANRWKQMKNTITSPRTCFAVGVIGGMVYIAGGKTRDGFELNSGSVFNPNAGSWHPITNMATNMSCYDSVVMNDKLFVTEGWFWPFYFVPRGQVYDPKTDTWECMPTGLREGWTGSGFVMFDRLFVVSEHERTRVKVYDSGSDTWETVKGCPLPDQICKPFVVNGYDDRIYVVGKNLNVAVGVICRLNKSLSEFFVEWRVVEASRRFCDVTPTSAQIMFA